MASLSRTMGTPTNAYKGTVSVWVKRCAFTGNLGIFNGNSDASNLTEAYFNADGTLSFYANSGGSVDLKTSRVFRDPAAWYHVVYAWDTTQGSSTDRVKLYINGVQETVFSPATYPGSSQILQTNISGNTFNVGAVQGGTGFDGNMAHFHFIDGLQYAASDFGETDSTSGIWVAKTSPSVTYGDNGFFLKFASGAITTDSSGEGNTMTQVGTITTTKDTPDNNFATLNLLDGNIINSGGLQNGGTTYNKSSTGSGYNTTCLSTLAVSSGKWYWETKIADASAIVSGFMNTDHGAFNAHYNLFNVTAGDGWGWYNNGTRFVGTTQTASYFNTFTTNDIISFALDLDNGKCYAAKNGTWENSGDPTSGATGTGSFADITTSSTYFITPACTNNNYAVASKVYYNFGNGYFGTTSHGETNADDAGIGLFKYDVPAGYYALCTTNLGSES